MTIYLSIDVATKSLAIGIYQINSIDLTTEESLDNNIVPIMMNVYDLGNGKNAKDTSIDDKARALKLVLDSVDTYLILDSADPLYDTNSTDIQFIPFITLIEYQMNANHMSNAIYNMLMYHYAPKSIVHTIKPTLKNTIYCHNKLKLSDFLASASSNYTANKNHCKYNFIYFMALFGHSAKISHIKQKNIDDIADTFMQCVAFHKRCK